MKSRFLKSMSVIAIAVSSAPAFAVAAGACCVAGAACCIGMACCL
ncbi:hypothetical protein [Hydrogenophaga sp. PBL-H3]|nr:hypothetical protein [Hydrogenophaga sp. PBL-H3]